MNCCQLPPIKSPSPIFNINYLHLHQHLQSITQSTPTSTAIFIINCHQRLSYTHCHSFIFRTRLYYSSMNHSGSLPTRMLAGCFSILSPADLQTFPWKLHLLPLLPFPFPRTFHLHEPKSYTYNVNMIFSNFASLCLPLLSLLAPPQTPYGSITIETTVSVKSAGIPTPAMKLSKAHI